MYYFLQKSTSTELGATSAYLGSILATWIVTIALLKKATYNFLTLTEDLSDVALPWEGGKDKPAQTLKKLPKNLAHRKESSLSHLGFLQL